MRMLSLATLLTVALVTTPVSEAHAEDIRLEFQGRVDVFNTFGFTGASFALGGGGGLAGLGAFNVDLAMVPLVTLGVRVLDGALFAGLGIGYSSSTNVDCEDIDRGGCADREDTTTTSSWSISPMVNYEFLSTEHAGFYLVAWGNMGTWGSMTDVRERTGQPRVTVETDANFWWGFDVGVGIRGKITPALSLGTEWGWGIAGAGVGDNNREDTLLVHGFWGTLTLSASIGL